MFITAMLLVVTSGTCVGETKGSETSTQDSGGWIQGPAVTVKRPEHFAEGDRGATERNDVTEIARDNNGNESDLNELTENGSDLTEYGSEYTAYPDPLIRE